MAGIKNSRRISQQFLTMRRAILSLLCFMNLAILPAQEAPTVVASADSFPSYNRVWRVHPFADSMRTDSTRKILRAHFTPQFNKTPLPRQDDPLSPFRNLVYKRQSISRNWFFYSTLLILLMLIANRSFFPSLFYARFRALFSRSQFNDLLEDMKTNIGPSSILSVLIGQAAYAQLIVVWCMYSGYIQLANNPVFFIVLLALLLLWRLILFLNQSLHCYLLDLTAMHRIITLFKTNFELFTALGLLPLSLILYFNVEPLTHPEAGNLILYLLLLLLVLRVIISVFMQIRYGFFNFFGILYFCALEILPHLLLFTFIRQTLT